MVETLRLLLFAFLVIKASSYDDITVGDLEDDTAAELEFLIEKYPDLKPTCTGHEAVTSAQFLLYNRNNPTKPIQLNETTMTQIDPNKNVVMVIHGWLASAGSSHILQLKDAYLKRYDCNFISVNWTTQAFQPYSKAYCDTPGIAQAITQLLCSMVEDLLMPLDMVHLVGHSFGGQIAGFVGQYVKEECKQQIGRITALDPAGPGFQYLFDDDEKLDKKDARFVDVIHTDEGSTGAWRNCGHMDFHPNCGTLQPGCPNIRDVVNETKVSDALCHSLRSMEYMIESISSNDFIAVSCGLCPRSCHYDIISEVYAVMGEDCQQLLRAMAFTIPTKNSPPYANGWEPYKY